MDYHSGPNVGFWANILWKSEKCGKVEIIEICNIRTWLATTGLKMELVGGGGGDRARRVKSMRKLILPKLSELGGGA